MAAPDVELALTGWIRTRFGVATCTELPSNLGSVLPIVQVEHIGGLGSRFSASPRVDVDVYAATYEATRDLAQSIHGALVMLRGTVGELVIRDVRVDTLPSRRPYDNPAFRRVGVSYTVSVRPNLFA